MLVFNYLDRKAMPAIVHWEGNHWMVLYHVTKEFVHVADPALGLRRIPIKEFQQKWSGYAALFDYTTAFDKALSHVPALLRGTIRKMITG